MTKRQFKKLKKLIEKAFELSRKNRVYSELMNYSDLRFRLKKALDAMNHNEVDWTYR